MSHHHLRRFVLAAATGILLVISTNGKALPATPNASTGTPPSLLSLAPDPTSVALRTQTSLQSWEPPPPPPPSRCWSADPNQYWQVDDNMRPTVPITFNCNGFTVASFTYHGVDRYVTREPQNPNPSSEIIDIADALVPQISPPQRLAATRIHLITYASWALDMPTGTEIGSVVLHFRTGSPQTLPLQVGVNTAEWSYDRSEAQGCLQHNKLLTRLAYSWQTSQDSQYSYMAHNYYSFLDLDGRELVSIELQANPNAYLLEVDDGSTCSTPGKYNVGITAVTLQGDLVVPIHDTTWGRMKSFYR